MPKLVRSASLTNYVEVARSAGLDPRRMLAGVGLTQSCLQDPDVKIPEDAVRRLLEASAAAAHLDDFGLRMAERRSLSNLGALALLVRDQPTVRWALEVWNQNRKVHTDSVSLQIEEHGDEAIISLAASIEAPVPARQAVEMTIGVLYRVMRQFLGERWRPRVCFVHSAPRYRETHRRVFGARVEFNRDFNGIVCRSRDLDAPIPAADPAMARYAQQFVDLIGRKDGTFAGKVRELVRMTLSSGVCRMELIARHLGLDRKTVNRRLTKESTSYATVVDEVRTELVNRYIKNGERPLSAVAEMLGFSDASAFSRWFKARFECSPSQWRNQPIVITTMSVAGFPEPESPRARRPHS